MQTHRKTYTEHSFKVKFQNVKFLHLKIVKPIQRRI